MKKNKKRNRVMLLLILLLGITVGFAALATTLKINGNASITKNNWSVYWDEESIAVTQGSKGDTIPEVENGEDGSINTKVTWSVNLEVPGDFYEFTIDAANAGTIDAMITGITPTLPQDLPSYVSYSVTYDDGIEPAQYHLLPKGTKSGSTITPTTEKYKVRIEFKNTITPEQMDAIPEEGLSLDFGYEVTYGQADDNAINPRLALGEYFTLVPDASTYTVLSTDSGYETDQTITPNELTLWRVININSDGSVDAVSEYASSELIAFRGVTGYAKYVGTLQNIAAQYAKSGYTVGTRMMGYDGQTLEITDTSAFDGTSSTAPSSTTTPSPTEGTGEEYGGGSLGDTLYLKDIQLVANLYKTDTATYGTTGLGTKPVGYTYNALYWLASRYYNNYPSNIFAFDGRFINGSFGIEINELTRYEVACSIIPSHSAGTTACDPTESVPKAGAHSVRPIITLKSGVVKASGTGTKTDPYIFQ